MFLSFLEIAHIKRAIFILFDALAPLDSLLPLPVVNQSLLQRLQTAVAVSLVVKPLALVDCPCLCYVNAVTSFGAVLELAFVVGVIVVEHDSKSLFFCVRLA